MSTSKSAKASRKSSDGVTTGLLVAILAVGICILCVSIAGMLSVTNGQGGSIAHAETKARGRQAIEVKKSATAKRLLNWSGHRC